MINKHNIKIKPLNKISNERIFVELIKILKNKNFYNLFTENNSREILLNIFPQFKYYERLKIINTINTNLRANYDTDLILSLLLLDGTKDYEYFCHKYSTSNSTKNKFKNLLKTQRNILDYGASLTKIGGELVYITCSILNKENKFQINAFLQDNINFEIVDLKHSWDSVIKSKLWLGNEKYCQLLPNIHECDGFFIARLIKIK